MAPTVESVEELTDLIAAKAVPAAKKELEEITALARLTNWSRGMLLSGAKSSRNPNLT
jgi:hypothetical protein